MTANIRRKLLVGGGAILLAAGLFLYLRPHSIGRFLVRMLSQPYEHHDGPLVASHDPPAGPTSGTSHGGQAATQDAQNALDALDVRLEPVAKGLHQVTDIQFPPGFSGHAVVLQKPGTLRWLDMASGTHGVVLRLNVLTESEQGLLGIAFHPRFASNGRFYLNYTVEADGSQVTRVEGYRVGTGGAAPTVSDLKGGRAASTGVLMEIAQPYQNHNAGQLAFGPDGYLYIGLGDGGLADDPHGNGQDTTSLLGSMLRIDVDGPAAGGKPYAIPADNPFVGHSDFRPEVWAYGLRNPWRYSFEEGRLVVADVGQNLWEEISIARAGDNLGWNVREGFSCFDDDDRCTGPNLVAPVFAYGRNIGSSITGGYVYRGTAIPALRGRYVFGDFVTGRLMAIALPADRKQRVKSMTDLGKWPVLISTFGRDAQGELYVGGFGRGEIYRLAPASPPKT